MKKYDAKQLADLHANERALQQNFKQVCNELNEAYESDQKFDDQRLADYTAKQQRHAQLSREIAEVRGDIAKMELLEPARAKSATDSPFSRFLRGGSGALDLDEQKAHIGEITDSGIPGGGGETFIIHGPQAATRSDDATGQELVQETIRPSVIDDLAFFGGASQMAQQFRTATGGDFRVPGHDQADQEGELLAAQNTAATAQDIASFTIINFGAFTATSKSIAVTREMIQDSIIDIQSYVERQAVRRLGRMWNKLFTSGDGASKPEGILQKVATGITAASATALTWPETVDLPYKINRAYRMGGEIGMGGLSPETGGQIGYMISDDAERILRRLVDGDSRPLWVPSTQMGVPNRLNGYPYVVNSNIDAVATGKIPMLFGNFSYFGIRTVNTLEIFRFMDSRTMQKNAIECLAFSRRDSKWMGAFNDASKCEAVVKLTMA